MAPRKSEKLFCFLENSIWIRILELSLWRTRYFSSAVNVLRSSPKIWHVNKREFFQLNLFGSGRWIWSKCCDEDLNSAWARLPCCFWKGPLKRDFLDIYQITFSESVIYEPQKLWLSSFYSKCSKFNKDFHHAAESWENFFCFSHSWIWIGIRKLSLLRTGYISSAANMLTSSPQI